MSKTIVGGIGEGNSMISSTNSGMRTTSQLLGKNRPSSPNSSIKMIEKRVIRPEKKPKLVLKKERILDQITENKN